MYIPFPLKTEPKRSSRTFLFKLLFINFTDAFHGLIYSNGFQFELQNLQGVPQQTETLELYSWSRFTHLNQMYHSNVSVYCGAPYKICALKTNLIQNQHNFDYLAVYQAASIELYDSYFLIIIFFYLGSCNIGKRERYRK